MVSETRAIMPLPVLLQLVDVAAACRSPTIIVRALPQQSGCFVGARPNTQALDIAHSLQLVVEKGLDNGSRAALAQSGVQTFFDQLDIPLICQWLLSNGCSLGDISCVLRQKLLA